MQFPDISQHKRIGVYYWTIGKTTPVAGLIGLSRKPVASFGDNRSPVCRAVLDRVRHKIVCHESGLVVAVSHRIPVR